MYLGKVIETQDIQYHKNKRVINGDYYNIIHLDHVYCISKFYKRWYNVLGYTIMCWHEPLGWVCTCFYHYKLYSYIYWLKASERIYPKPLSTILVYSYLTMIT